ncbi:hypothetical protein [Candidatus Protochlamydia phocaeensis]|uniref:hypothetical protein n=1 Tax=Candidatus Protochlamydia phocaeensis TaxID=1414722 RepID=UPI00083831D4|nr:hypothetical protein [Candidatus Protochlamydia phocaeensis]
MEDQFLEKLEAVLDRFGYPCLLHKASQEMPFEHLSLTLPRDSKNRERICILKIEKDVLAAPAAQEATESFVHIYTVLPFTVEPQSIGEVARLINFFNKSLLVPGFILDEAGKSVFFRYAFLKPGSMLEDATFISLIGTILLWLDSFSDSIEEVAKGKSMVEVIQERMNELLQLPAK